ncbi:tyrosine-protein phosphatase [Cohnella sp. REN36]|uniref:tyrosine-protein phosphatase n=1 Tax=Cohnella sp. REN36 TaxID=2887347 RepID=UPI001D15AF88|nr:CpsB/CapC family capsule biosynthesis tyrosine phosphatase [Cohnella sp. REN36]MCC3375545.1 tyrosine protein phosphatase [Cohnella sp. REN36]
MVDLHSHILPGMDDGPASLEMSLEMARMAVREGIEVVYATPHHLLPPYDNERSTVVKAVARLSEALRAAKIPLQVRAGQEIRMTPEWLREAYEGKLLPLSGTTYTLIELPSAGIPEHLPHAIHEMGVLGWRPIIAHPERNREIAKHPERLLPFVEAGALCQLTSHSLTGRFGKETQTAALTLCKRGYIHLVASDAHDCERRPFELRVAYEMLEAKFGSVFVQRLQRNAKLIAAGKQAEAAAVVRRRTVSSVVRRWVKGR